MNRRVFAILLCLVVLMVPCLHAGAIELQPAEAAKDRLLQVCEAEQFEFTPKLRNALLAYAKQQALVDLEAEEKSLPKDFLEWIDSDSVVEAGVYGVHHKPADVLLWLYSLRLDLGKARFEEYRQLALAAAIVSAKEGMAADITPREPLKLVIPGDPRKLVDTKNPNRELDVNDHIINFLNDHTIEEEVVIGHKEAIPELKYDERGIAIPAPKNQKPKKVPITEARVRSLYAADVIASADLQREFNDYMKSQGQDVKIDCGERIVHWNSRDMVRGEQYKKIDEAYRMFRTAYEAKGLLPMKRDPFASPAERCLYLIRNYEYEFPKDLQADRKWPRFPLTAPWPVLTMLAADRQPLREREERWEAFRDRGELKTYGEYIGGIAQQHAMQSARRLKPYPFSYATIQMMLKDGGVCGTMGSISARSHVALGIPACQATQPGHCAMVAYHCDPESNAYSCKGGQYATGGDEKTGPFTPWPFADVFRRTGRKNGYEIAFHNRKPMVYHQSVAWGINYGVQSYLDSVIAYAVFRVLPEAQRQTHGLELLESGLAVNPYNFLLVDAAQDLAGTPQEQMRFWKSFQAALKSAAGKPGCPTEGLYNSTVKNKMAARIAKLPVPEDKSTALDLLAFLEEEKCEIPAALADYRASLDSGRSVAGKSAVGPAAAKPAGQNREPLKPQPYLRLPLGSVQAESWLKHQLELQRDGLTGHAEELYNDIGESDWISDQKRGGQHAWERGPYYAKGLITLAYVLDDQALKDKAQEWIDRVLISQRENGDFGPKDRNWWPNMIVLHYLRNYYDATGDERVPPFFEKYFRFQLGTLPEHPLHKESGWAKARGGDNLEIVLWMYNRTGEKWLLDLARLLMQQTNEWHKYYAEETGDNWYPNHIVNIMQGLKTPPLMYLVSGDRAHKNGFAVATSPDGWILKKCGRVDGMISGTEPLRDRSSTQGTELCAIVERILATTVAMRVLGDAEIGDQLERVAYNALPAALSPDIKGMRYYILPNQPKCTNENLGSWHNGQGRNAICPSPHAGYACCRSNFHYGWPTFVHNMWMATADTGLAIAAYGPNTVTAKMGKEGTPVTIDQETDYPFAPTSKLTIHTEGTVNFPLELRIPSWCEEPTVLVNNKPVTDVTAGTYHRIERAWSCGDVVQISCPMPVKISHWINDSVAVTRGPLAFSLLIEEEKRSTQSFLDDQFHTHEIRPASAWNYAILLAGSPTPAIETTVAETMPAQPLKAADAPVRLQLKAVKTDLGGWGKCREDFPARAVEPPQSPVQATGNVETITLVPYGSTEIRITQFPWVKK